MISRFKICHITWNTLIFTTVSLLFSCAEISNRRVKISEDERTGDQLEVRTLPRPSVSPTPDIQPNASTDPSPSSTPSTNPTGSPRPSNSPSSTPNPSTNITLNGPCGTVSGYLENARLASGFPLTGFDSCLVDSDCTMANSHIRCTATVCSTGCGFALNRLNKQIHDSFVSHADYVSGVALLTGGNTGCAYAIPNCFAVFRYARCVSNRCTPSLNP